MGGLPKSGRDDRRSNPNEFWKIVAPLHTFAITTTQAVVRGQIYYQSFQLPQRLTVNRVYFYISTPSGTARLGIYSDSNGTPSAKQWDSGNIGQGTRTSATVAVTLDPGLYWLAETFSTNAGLAQRGSGFENFSSISGATNSYRAGSLASNTISLPSTVGAITSVSNANFYWLLNVSS